MKRALTLVSLLGFAGLMMGCATSYPIGFLYSELKLPVTATDASGQTLKMGTAECQSFMGLIAVGDASIETAKKNGGITTVHHVDWEVENVLGFVGKYKVVVYGQ